MANINIKNTEMWLETTMMRYFGDKKLIFLV